MTFDKTALFDALNSVISIPLIPFNDDIIDFEGHRKNIQYLMENNYLSDKRPRVISLAGTSLIHHDVAEQGRPRQAGQHRHRTRQDV
jgi:hypothetical protein